MTVARDDVNNLKVCWQSYWLALTVGGLQSDVTLQAVHLGVTFHDICYEMSQWKCCVRKPNKQILKNLTGQMTPGLNAIMGPTGSGKTT